MTAYSQTLTDSLGVADRHTWSEMVFTWDDYIETWDDYGEIPALLHWTGGRTFTDAIAHTEIFTTIATIHRTLTDAITHTESFLKATIKTLSDSISHSEIFSRIATAIRNLSDSIAHAEAVMHMVSKNLVETLSLTEAVIKNIVRHLSDTMGLTEFFSRIPQFIRTLTDNLSVAETDWTWDMMTHTWDDYTENWTFYGGAFTVLRIYVRTIVDSVLMTEMFSILRLIFKPLSYVRSSVMMGGVKIMNVLSRSSSNPTVSKVKDVKIISRVISENIIGKFK
jgi:hypothetical protein